MDFHFIDKVISSGPDRFKGRLQFFQIPAGTPICDIPKGIVGRIKSPILAYRIGHALGLYLAGGLVWLLILRKMAVFLIQAGMSNFMDGGL